MPITAKEIFDSTIAKYIREQKRGRYAAGGNAPGLYLRIEGNSAAWVLRTKIGDDGRRVEIGLGPYQPKRDGPDLTPIHCKEKNLPEPYAKTLSEARDWSRLKRGHLRNGDDLVAIKRADKAAKKLKADAPKPTTFGECALETIANRTASMKNAKARQQWTKTLERYCKTIWDEPIGGIDHNIIANLLKPEWISKHETMRRVRMRMEATFNYAISKGYASSNPALVRLLGPLLPTYKHEKKKHAALPYRKVGGFMLQLRERNGLGARALELGILCGSRSGEVRGMVWDELHELDGDEPVWRIPKARMKASKDDHTVCLSPQAVAILKARRDEPRIASVPYVFPSSNGRTLSDMTLSKVLRDMGLTDITVHGFRSSFKDFAANETQWPDEVSEEVLAHTVGSSVRNDYRRGEALAKRRKLLEEWADYCDRPYSNVVPIKAAL